MRRSQFFKNISPIWLLLLFISVFSACKTSYQPTGSYTPNMVQVNASVTQDADMESYIKPYRTKLDSSMNVVIGTADLFLTKKETDGQSLIGNFFADAMLDLGKELDREVVCAIGTKGGIRTQISKGNITIGNIFELMPFENYLTVLELSGKDMLTLGNFIAKANGHPISGMTVVINSNSELVEMRIQGNPVDPNKSYKLVTYDYLANGGDNIKGLSSPIHRADSPTRVREGLISHIEKITKSGKTITAKLDGRVKISQ